MTDDEPRIEDNESEFRRMVAYFAFAVTEIGADVRRWLREDIISTWYRIGHNLANEIDPFLGGDHLMYEEGARIIDVIIRRMGVTGRALTAARLEVFRLRVHTDGPLLSPGQYPSRNVSHNFRLFCIIYFDCMLLGGLRDEIVRDDNTALIYERLCAWFHIACGRLEIHQRTEPALNHLHVAGVENFLRRLTQQLATNEFPLEANHVRMFAQVYASIDLPVQQMVRAAHVTLGQHPQTVQTEQPQQLEFAYVSPQLGRRTQPPPNQPADSPQLRHQQPQHPAQPEQHQMRFQTRNRHRERSHERQHQGIPPERQRQRMIEDTQRIRTDFADRNLFTREYGEAMRQANVIPNIRTPRRMTAWFRIVTCAEPRMLERRDSHALEDLRSADRRPVIERLLERLRAAGRLDWVAAIEEFMAAHPYVRPRGQ